jgi:hypothetical protein
VISPHLSVKACSERVMGRAHRRDWISVVAGAALLILAWSLGLWLIVLALCSAAAVVGRHRVFARRVLPARLAAWAAHAPYGPSPPIALEHALAVDLAAVSRGYLDCLERAHGVLAGRIDDRWRCALGAERLARAQRLVGDGQLMGLTPRREPRLARLCCSAAAGATVVLVAVGTLSQSQQARCLLERAGQHPRACRRLVHAERLIAQRAGSRPSELPRRLP